MAEEPLGDQARDDDHTMMHISQALADRMVDHAITELPREMCGLLIGSASDFTFMPITNVAPEHDRFQMDAEEQLEAFQLMRKKRLELAAIVHSHVNVHAEPSARDIEEMAYNTLYVIIGLSNARPPSIRAFRIIRSAHTWTEEGVVVQ